MGRDINQLNARLVSTLKEPGRYPDGGNLYLRVTPTQKSWVFWFRWQERQTEIGLGAVGSTSLAEARRKAETARQRLAAGQHPGKEKLEQARSTPTFGEVADEHLAGLEQSWKNDKHRAQWFMTLGRARDADGSLTGKGYCLGLADKPVNEITVDDVLAELRPIWSTKPETASRIYGFVRRDLVRRPQTGGSRPAGPDLTSSWITREATSELQNGPW